MTDPEVSFPKWLLIVSGLLALLELTVSVSLIISPESVADKIDLTAKGVDYLLYMWASRQFALGVILAFAVYKKSAPMLTIAYIFLVAIFIGDVAIGIVQKETSMIISGLFMSILSSVLIYAINKSRR